LTAIYQFLGLIMKWPLTFFIVHLHSYGLAIILVTVLIRLVMAPISVRQFQSMRQMQIIQPEMKALQERYKGEPQKLQQAQAELFREYKINPLAGCLPLLIQLPFLWGLYYALMHLDYHNAGFFWIPSLSGHDPYYILPILSGVTTLLSTQLSMRTSMQGQDKTQQYIMMFFMPAMIVYFTIRYPAGLALYWTVSQIFTVAQQWLFFRQPPTLPGSQQGTGTGKPKVQHAR
jgi:YidC/Oxa1 family membrane protein insertase